MIVPILLLLTLGITVIYSSSPPLAIQQLIFSIVGVLFYFGLRYIDYRALTPLIRIAYFSIIIFLIITFIIGFETRGSVRWITFGIFNFQPSEFAKPILILALASFWTYHKATWINVLKSLVILLPIAGLVFEQPDLGTTLTLCFIWIGILIAANISIIKLTILSLIGLITIPVGWLFLEDYQKQRIYSFLSPTNDPQGIGFHVIQSMIAVGSGQLFGRGLGRGTQSRLQFLPEFRTDFIFAFIAEELGFLGSALVLMLYTTIFYFGYRILKNNGDRFGELIVIGVFSMLFFQSVINIGMNIGALPITGITLPLLSYGGSSIVTTFICLGLVASVGRFGKRRTQIDTFSLT